MLVVVSDQVSHQLVVLLLDPEELQSDPMVLVLDLQESVKVPMY